MPASWTYIYQYALSQVMPTSIVNDPFLLIMFGIMAVDGIFLAGLIWTLYRNYRNTESIESLLFLIRLLLIFTSLILYNVARFCYSSLGSPELGELIYIFTQSPVLVGALCFNIFAVRATFQKHAKIVFAFVLIIGIIYIAVMTWAVIVGPPYYDVVNFDATYSLEIIYVRLFCLLPILTIPASVLFYYAIHIREEDKPKSTISLWLGIGIVFFAVAYVINPIAVELRFIGVLIGPAPIIFYICFSMPDWFKRRIGWAD